MAKFFGKLGFSETFEEVVDGKTTGVWKRNIVERPYYGDVIRRSYKYSNGDKTNTEVDISNEVSIVYDEYALAHLSNLIFVEWSGAKWCVTNVSVERPRLTLSIGGVYNGDTP